MKCRIYCDEMYPVYYLHPNKEDGEEDGCTDIPVDMYERYKWNFEEFDKIQAEICAICGEERRT
jgi:hypothetical protein